MRTHWPRSAPVSNKIQNDCFDLGQYFRCQQTVDGKTWKVLASGDEVRTSQAGTRPDPRHN
jgi:hypothetical protein